MSHRATAWAVAQRTGSPTRKAVLVALADRHNADTGRCDPSIRRLAEDTEMGERTVQRALGELEAAGFIVRQDRQRASGADTTRQYHLALDSTGQSGTGRVSQRHPSELEVEPSSTSVANAPSVDGGAPIRFPTKVDRKYVTGDEAILANLVLATWNRVAGQDLRSTDWLAKIIMRLREYPEATLADHTLIIETALANPWWSGPPSPSVVYGNGAQFERSIAQVRQRQTVNADLEVALNRMRRRAG